LFNERPASVIEEEISKYICIYKKKKKRKVEGGGEGVGYCDFYPEMKLQNYIHFK